MKITHHVGPKIPAQYAAATVGSRNYVRHMEHGDASEVDGIRLSTLATAAAALGVRAWQLADALVGAAKQVPD